MPSKNMQIRPVGDDDYGTVLHPETNTDVVLNKATGRPISELLKDASTTQKGFVQLSTSVTSTSTDMAATPSAVKAVKDSIPLLNNTTTSTSTTEAATANAVKRAYDLGNSAYNQLNSQPVNIGSSSSASGLNTVAIGYSSTATGNRGVAVGAMSNQSSDESVALGYNAKANASYSTALGPNTSISGLSQQAVIGYNSVGTNQYEGVLGVSASSVGPSRWKVPGTLSVSGTKNFEIPHPHPDKKHTHIIRHGAVESPTPGDTLYRYEVTANEDGQLVETQLPDYFQYLNTNIDVWVSPHLHFGRAYGIVEGDVLKVTCEKAGKYKALVIGTRNDDNVQDWYIKGMEREVGESWLAETYVFETDEFIETVEFEEVI